jgi:hypothetical protein
MFESQLAQAASGPVSVFAPKTVAAAEVPKTDAGPASGAAAGVPATDAGRMSGVGPAAGGAAAAAGQQQALPGHPERAESVPVPEPVQPMAADAAGQGAHQRGTVDSDGKQHSPEVGCQVLSWQRVRLVAGCDCAASCAEALWELLLA